MVLGKKVAIFDWEWGRNSAPRDGQKLPCKQCSSQSLPCFLTQSRYVCFVCLIWFFTSHQQSFSFKGTGLPGLNQY